MPTQQRIVLAALMLTACGAASEPSASTVESIATQSAPVRSSDRPSAPGCFGPPTIGNRSPLGTADALDEALAYGGLDRDSLGLGAERTASSALDFADARMLDGARAALRRPLDLRERGRGVAAALDAAMASDRPVTRAIVAASSIREAPVTACIDPAWLVVPPGKQPLAVALVETGLAPPGTNLRDVPLGLQQALVAIVRALAWAADDIVVARSSGGAVAPTLLGAIASVPGWILGTRRFELSDALVGAFERVDTQRIATAAANVAYVVEHMNLRRFAGTRFPSVTLPTRIGSIVLRSVSNDVWDSTDAPALLLDTGGDDVYYGPLASSSLARPISVAMDLGGRDLYAYREIAANDIGTRLPSDGSGRAADGRTLSTVGRQGSGVLGVGLLFDLGAESDRYRSLVGSQGAGSHGVGVLFDAGGDDLYEAEGFSQGAAAWGIGLLLDGSGDDRYRVFNSGQAFGFTRGIGALVDASGADVYTADPGDPTLGGSLVYPSDALPGPPSTPVAANHSFAQGCGAGHRPDWPDPGWPFPGGIGVLRDARGNDRYVAGVFAQACGFLQGVGMLLDGAGSDTYDALYWAQGAAAHMAAAALADDGGSDRYNTSFPVQGPMLGVGHDLAVALFGDASGDDVYRASWLAIGSGSANGIGVFVDAGGRDRFTVDSNLCLGAALTNDVRVERRTTPSVAMFVKANGSSTYAIGGNVVDLSGKTWTPSHVIDPTIEIGVGIDRPSGAVTW